MCLPQCLERISCLSSRVTQLDKEEYKTEVVVMMMDNQKLLQMYVEKALDQVEVKVCL